MDTKDRFGKVSVIMPFFNAEQYIEKAIESVLNQSYQNWELLVINDGSIDSSKQLVEAFVDNRIFYLEQENEGTAAARNLGLRSMSGDYFCFLDADDTFPPDSLMSRLRRFESDPALEFVDGQVWVMDSQMKSIERKWSPSFEGNPFKDLLSLSGKCFFGLTWMIKRRPGDYKMNEALTHSEDLLFYIELSRQNGLYGHTTDVILEYRNSPGSAMKNLKGLENGYRIVYKIISDWDEMDPLVLINYRQRTKRIMFRSYLRMWKIKNAVDVLRGWI